jgi:hypothetical protein
MSIFSGQIYLKSRPWFYITDKKQQMLRNLENLNLNTSKDTIFLLSVTSHRLEDFVREIPV